MNKREGVGQQVSTALLGWKAFNENAFGSSPATEPLLSPGKPPLPTAQQAAAKQAVVMEPECRVLALLKAPETLLCLPTLPLF